MNVDREQQKEILQILFDAYPWFTNDSYSAIQNMFNNEPERTAGNLLYLQKHGLIDNAIEIQRVDPEEFIYADLTNRPEGAAYTVSPNQYGPATLLQPEITEKGVDFLLGDEGLSSILNVKRVRIEESSLKILSTTLIDLAASSKTQRQSILDKLKEAPIEGISDYIKQTVSDELSSAELAKKIAHFILLA